jgi:hypothetical protein
MAKKSNTRSEAGKNATRTRKSRSASLQAAKTPSVQWVECVELDNLGHGVQFRHDGLQGEYLVAFLEGFEWRHGGSATVKILGRCPTSITPDQWSGIIESALRAVLVFLSNERHLNCAFRHGPIHIMING